MKANTCPFCEIKREIIFESEHCLAFYDKYPVNEGHVLVITRRHVKDYFELEQKEINCIWQMVNKVKSFLDAKFNPWGYNIGFNVGETAGQTIDHVHIHVIPRYKGDMDDPTGGVRHVIPGKGKY